MNPEAPSSTTLSDPYVPVRELPEYIPGLEAERSGSSALILRHHNFPEARQPLWCPADPNAIEIILIIDGSGCLERKLGGEWERGTVSPGNLIINPGPAGPQAWCGGSSTQLRAHLDRRVLRRVAGETSFDPDQVRVRPRFLITDPLIASLIRTTWTVLERERPTVELYADQTARTLALQLLKFHSTTEAPPDQEQEPSPRWLQQIEEFVDQHLGEGLCLEVLAERAGMSTSHFSHQFKRLEGKSPYQYVIERRMEEAKNLLRETDQSIAQVAFAVGYSSQSSFTTQFRKYVGLTPGQFRRRSSP